MAEENTYGLPEAEEELLQLFLNVKPEDFVEPDKDQPSIVSQEFADDPGRLSPGTEAPIDPYVSERVQDKMAEFYGFTLDGRANLVEVQNMTEQERRNDAIRHTNGAARSYGKEKVEPYSIPKEPQTLTSAIGRLYRPRDITVKPSEDGETFKKRRIREARESAQKFEKLKREAGPFDIISDIWSGSEPIPVEEAEKSGLGYTNQKFFGRAPEDEDDLFFIPYGIKNLDLAIERASAKLSVGSAFAPLFLKEDEKEAYKKTTNLEIPTENFEALVDKYELLKDQGFSREEIKQDHDSEFRRLLISQTYDDLPFGFQLNKPSVEGFKSSLKSNPDFFRRFKIEELDIAVDLVNQNKSDKEIQKYLNRIPFVALPAPVWGGTIPSADNLLKTTFDSIEKVIEAKGESGVYARVLAKDLENFMFNQELIGDDLVMVESTFGRIMRLLGLTTEGLAEIDVSMGATKTDVKQKLLDLGLPEDASENLAEYAPFLAAGVGAFVAGPLALAAITPASRDFYYEYGLRDPDTSWLARFAGNLETANIGISTHLTNEAIAQQFSRGDSEYHTKQIIGHTIDMIFPWERFVGKYPIAATRGTFRGARLANKYDFKGGWKDKSKWKLALAAGSPSAYNRLYNVAENVAFALNSLETQLAGEITAVKLKQIIDEDAAVYAARAEDQPIPTDEIGRPQRSLSYTEKNVAEQLLKKLESGMDLDKAINDLKKTYKPDGFETVYHALYTVNHHLLHTDEGARMFKRKRDDPNGVLSFEMEQQLDRTLIAAGIDPRQLKTAARRQAQLNKDEYTKNLKAAYYLGDADTIELRNSDQYKKVKSQLDELVEDGTIDVNQKIVLLSLLENRSYAAAADKQIKVPTPQDFFNDVKITKVARKVADGETPADMINVKVGRILDITSDNIDAIQNMFKSGDLMKMLDNDAQILVDMMGKRWTARFIDKKHNEPNPNFGPNTTKKRLTDTGKKEVEEILRTLASGVGRLGDDAPIALSMFENLQALYSRMRLESTRFVSPDVAGRLDIFLRPDRFYRNQLVDINIDKAVKRPGSTVFIKKDGEKLVEMERLGQAGRKRPVFDVDVHPDSVKQVLGITDQTQSVDAVDTYSRALAYVMAETFKKNESRALIGGRKITKLTPNTFVADDKADSIIRRTNARMASVLGIENHKKLSNQTYLDGAKLKGMANTKDETLTLNVGQQARFKVFLRRLSSEPVVGRRIPDDLQGPNADLSTVSIADYNRVVELMMDVESSGVSRRTTYTEVIPKSLGYSLVRALKRGALEGTLTRQIDSLQKTLAKIDKLFVLDDPLSGVRPELKELYRRELKRISDKPRDIINLARIARKQNPDAAVEEIFESMKSMLVHEFDPAQVDLIAGSYTLVGNRHEHNKGIGSLIEDFTKSEIARIDVEFEKLSQKDPKLEIDSKKQREIVYGKDIITDVDPEEMAAAGLDKGDQITLTGYAFPIPSGTSRIQFLTQNATQTLLHKAATRHGFKQGVTERVATALTVLQSYASDTGLTTKQVAKLADNDRVAIAEALSVIKERIDQNENKIISRGHDLLRSLGGETLSLDKRAPHRAAEVYKNFYSGGEKWVDVYELLLKERGRAQFGKKELSQFSPGQAFLEMITRMAVLDGLDGLYDTMIKHGMPGAYENYRTPKNKISTTGSQYSIETPSLFHERVKGHMSQIFTYGDIALRESGKKDQPSVVVEPPRTIRDVDYRRAAFEYSANRRPPRDYADLQALLAAEEALARFGKRTATDGDSLTDMVFPDGTQVRVPIGMEIELKNAIERVSRIGSAYMSDPAKVLRQTDVDTPYIDIASTATKKEIAYATVGRRIQDLIKFFPLTTTMVKQGITTGFVVPMVPYYVANFVGGYFQLLTAVGPLEATKTVMREPMMATSVTMRMYGQNKYNPGAKRLLITKSGQIYTQKQLADMALLYGLDSSFIQAETQRSMAEDIKQYIRNDQRKYSYKKIGDFARSWNDHLKETATAIDNLYRVSTFIGEIKDGVSPGQAAQLARRAAFDYGALTDFEKRVMRQGIMFYSYLRNNMNLFYDTLLVAPDRVFNQLRLANGLQQELMETERQVGMRDYLDGRLVIMARDSIRNTTEKEKIFNFLPPLPIMDSLNLLIDPYDAVMGDQTAQRMLATRLTPWIQAPIVAYTDIDPFYGGQIDNFNRVPPHMMEWLLIAFGTSAHKTLEVVPYSYNNPALRQVEGDDDRPIGLAGNGLLWWSMRNLVQIPPFGRYMTVGERLDRANLGIIEGITEAGKAARIYAEEAGLVEKVSDQFQPIDTASPRVDYTTFQEALGVISFIPGVTETQEFKAAKMQKDFEEKTKAKLPRYQDPIEQAAEKRLVDDY